MSDKITVSIPKRYITYPLKALSIALGLCFVSTASIVTHSCLERENYKTDKIGKCAVAGVASGFLLPIIIIRGELGFDRDMLGRLMIG